jgi:hypothetical protein
MMQDKPTPHDILAAVERMFDEFSILVGEDNWKSISAQLESHIQILRLSQDSTERLESSAAIVSIIAAYENTRQRLYDELTVQRIVANSIADSMRHKAKELDFQEEDLPLIMAALLALVHWDVDHETIHSRDITTTERTITLAPGGKGGGKSVHFKNLKLNLDKNKWAQLIAGSALTSHEIRQTSSMVVIAFGIILIIATLRDALTIALSEHEASLFWALISLKSNFEQVVESELFRFTNLERQMYFKKLGKSDLSQEEFMRALFRLEELGIIRSVQNSGEGRKWMIVENYSIQLL